ncbi:protein TRIGALACTOSYLDIACYLGLYCEROL 4, chloroplastic-like [Hibiscus syriacus]|nr:protein TRIGALACTOSYLDIACYLGLYCEROL 4, chloroplastic-like [Hibiscus syriacus]
MSIASVSSSSRSYAVDGTWMDLDLASLPSDSGPSYHLCLHHNHGSAKQFQGDPVAQVPASLLPGFFAKCAFSYKKNVNIWSSQAQKLKMVQPYDIFLSDPHVSASRTIGASLSANFGENSARLIEEAKDIKRLSLHHPTLKSSLLGDIFASMSFTAQHGNFQRLLSDLTRFQARMDFPSGSKFLSGATQVAQYLLNSLQPSSEAIKMIFPSTTLSLQQQIAGPFSFRVDSGVLIDFEDKSWHIQAGQPVFAIEYALHVPFSAKAVAWYSPKHQEFMVELRFFET